MLREILIILIVTGLGGLIVPSDPRTAVGRIGAVVRRAALGVVIATLVFAGMTAIDQPDMLFGTPPA